MRDSNLETAALPKKTSLALYCARHGSTPETFAEEVLWQCLYPQSLRLARWIWRLYPDYFHNDLVLIRWVFNQHDIEEIKSEINVYRRHHPAKGLLRGKMQVRLSGQRLLNLVNDLLIHAKTECVTGLSHNLHLPGVAVSEPRCSAAYEMKKRILIVDDEIDLQDLLMYHLNDHQVEFHSATNCAAALATAEQVQPDLILLDILLPDVDGLTLCEALRQLPATRQVPIAMMSAHDSEPTRQLALAAGADEFFSKPLNLGNFKATVNRLLHNPPVRTEKSFPTAA